MSAAKANIKNYSTLYNKIDGIFIHLWRDGYLLIYKTFLLSINCLYKLFFLKSQLNCEQNGTPCSESQNRLMHTKLLIFIIQRCLLW